MQTQQLMQVDNRQFVIVGSGISGYSALRYLLAQGLAVRLMDSRQIPPNAAEIKSLLPATAIHFGGFQQEWLEQSDVIVLSPGVSPQQPPIAKAVAQGVTLIGDVELFAQTCKKPYIAITGSNGKSTVTSLVTELLSSQGIKASMGGNIGTPVLDLLQQKEAEIYVLELSSFQLETCPSLAPVAATVLNISDDHMDRHSSLDSYREVKDRIYERASYGVYAQDYAMEMHSHEKGVVHFGVEQQQNTEFTIALRHQQRWIMQSDEALIAATELTLPGMMGELNVLAALALVKPYIRDMNSVLSVLRSFKGLPHRCQIVTENAGVLWVNDSKGTNPGATVAAIESFDRDMVLILGGIHKGGSIEDLIKLIRQRVHSVILLGRDAAVFAQALEVHSCYSVPDLMAAVKLSNECANQGDVVLFSPACASFDMFADYQQRGDSFMQCVQTHIVGGQHVV